MSGGKRGGELAQMDELSRLFKKHAANLDALIKDLNGRTVSSSEIWWGPGAERFRSAWQEAKGAFDKMAVALEEGSQDIQRSAQNIERATA
jgi:WXG100 family type VII secretion target